MQHAPYVVKYQFDLKGELKELKYEPTMIDVKTKFEEMILSLHNSIDRLTGADHSAEITAKLTIEKISSGYEATVGLWIDGNKYEIVTHTNADNSATLITNIKKSLNNEIAHKNKSLS